MFQQHDRYQTAIYAGLIGVWTVSINIVETQPTGRLEFTIPFGLMDYTIRKSVETTLDGPAEYTVEVP